MALRIALASLALLVAGCAEALYTSTSFRSHDAYTDADYARYQDALDSPPLGKAEVLATLGPPLQVIRQESGDVFVYRRQAVDVSIINLNPGMVSVFGPTVPVPLYFDSTTSGRSDTLMVFFDAHGRMQGDSERWDIEAHPLRSVPPTREPTE
jgi:hypothetical protein